VKRGRGETEGKRRKEKIAGKDMENEEGEHCPPTNFGLKVALEL